MSEELLTAREVATLLGVAPSWVRAASRAGRLPTVNLGRYRRYRRSTIDAWIHDQERQRRSTPSD
jgi:excisionase family DNA binding protein